MAEISDDKVIALAKALLRQTILASGWYPSLRDAERQKRIDQDVDLHWPLMVADARKRLEEKGQLACGPADHEANGEEPHEEGDQQEPADVQDQFQRRERIAG